MVENNGKPNVLMDDLGGFSTPLFLENIQISINVDFLRSPSQTSRLTTAQSMDGLQVGWKVAGFCFAPML